MLNACRRLVYLHARIDTRSSIANTFHYPYHVYQSKSKRYGSSSSSSVGPNVGGQGLQGEEDVKDPKVDPSQAKWGPTFFKMFESAATTMASILVLA